jgi:hypothetical protein
VYVTDGYWDFEELDAIRGALVFDKVSPAQRWRESTKRRELGGADPGESASAAEDGEPARSFAPQRPKSSSKKARIAVHERLSARSS